MINLDDPAGLCPGLDRDSATILGLRAAVALERRHAPGVLLHALVLEKQRTAVIRWSPTSDRMRENQDASRVTEEGAEALALALAGQDCGWRVVRRLQSHQREGADWLMANDLKQWIILEVSGTDSGSLERRLGEKMTQARGSRFAAQNVPAACVVRFVEPRAVLRSADGPG